MKSATGPPFEVAQPYDTVINALPEVLTGASLKVQAVDPASGVVQAKRSMSMGSYGDNITVQLGASGPAATSCTVRSEVVYGLIDFGHSKRQVKKVTDTIVAAFGGAPPPPTG